VPATVPLGEVIQPTPQEVEQAVTPLLTFATVAAIKTKMCLRLKKAKSSLRGREGFCCIPLARHLSCCEETAGNRQQKRGDHTHTYGCPPPPLSRARFALCESVAYQSLCVSESLAKVLFPSPPSLPPPQASFQDRPSLFLLVLFPFAKRAAATSALPWGNHNHGVSTPRTPRGGG